jgi:DNA polymerase-1
MKRLVLIDGHAILHRAYHAFPSTLKTRRGELVNAVYGFTRILLTVLEDLKPNFLAVAFDLPGPTFRHQEYVGYQIQRPEMDRELAGQIERVYQMVKTLNIPIFTSPSFEADDVIGTLAKQAALKNVEVMIVTGDKDIMQLVNKKVRVYAPKKGFAEPEIFDEKKVKIFLGVTPKKIIDYKALVGDASDNYPGVSGIGPKTAVELLNQYGDLKTIYKNLKKIKSLLAQKLEDGQENAYLSQKLATIVTKVPLKLNLKACLVHDYDHQKAIKLFEELEFKSLINKLPGIKKVKEEKKDESNQMNLL